MTSKDEKKFRIQQYDNLLWNKTEQALRLSTDKKTTFCKSHQPVTFNFALCAKFRKSVFGTYLDYFNAAQNQSKFVNENKLGITVWNLDKLGSEGREHFDKHNQIIDNSLELLREITMKCSKVSFEFFYEKLSNLRIHDYYITHLDKTLRNFKNLKVLVLTSNYIQDIEGKYLPRHLGFLELFNNSITSVENLCKKAPKNLLHLGLGRNKLTNKSKLHLLAECDSLTHLRTLDLSDNDIYDLQTVLTNLQRLESLTSLQLQGNPCACVAGYKEYVLNYFSLLSYLDDVEVLDIDRQIILDQTDLKKAQVIFSCFRIIGLPSPPKNKNLKQTIHVEVSLPLLETAHLGDEISESEYEYDNDEEEPTIKELNKRKSATKKSAKKTKGTNSTKTKDKDKDKEKDKNRKTKMSSEKSKKIKDEDETETKQVKPGKQNYYTKANEYRSSRKKYSFQSEAQPWSKIIQFPPIYIESPTQNLLHIRDTFRSVVNVRVVYLKLAPGKKKTKKIKSANKKSLKSKKTQKSVVSSDLSTSEPEKEPEDKVLKEITLANFNCSLSSVSWSDQSVDFYWADHPGANPNAVPVQGSLKSVLYEEGSAKNKEKKKKKSNDKKGKKGKLSDRQDSEMTVLNEEQIPQKLPKLFTCQVGFGLKRSNDPICFEKTN